MSADTLSLSLTQQCFCFCDLAQHKTHVYWPKQGGNWTNGPNLDLPFSGDIVYYVLLVLLIAPQCLFRLLESRIISYCNCVVRTVLPPCEQLRGSNSIPSPLSRLYSSSFLSLPKKKDLPTMRTTETQVLSIPFLSRSQLSSHTNLYADTPQSSLVA